MAQNPARTHTVELPAGLAVTLREFQVTDEDLLANPILQRQGAAIAALLDSVTISVESPGLYALRNGRLDWKKVLKGECDDALRQNRIFTWDPDYEVTGPCPNCRQPTKNNYDLREFEVQRLPEGSVQHVRAANPSESPLKTKLPGCGRGVEFRLLRAEDDRALGNIRKEKKETQSSSYLRLRTIAIEGIAMPDLQSFIKTMGGGDSAFLRYAMEEQDCGVQQEKDHSCDECGHMWRDDVAFTRGFLFPKFRGKAS